VRTDPTFWVMTRTSAVTAYALVTLSMLAGLVLKSRSLPGLRASTVTDIHRVLTSLALIAVAVHGTSLLFDSKLEFVIRDLLVPWGGPYRIFWTGVGIVTAEVMVIVYLSFSVRRWIGFRAWRALHWLAYGIFVAATAHGLMDGTDSSRPWALGLYVGAIGAVVAATCWRALVAPVIEKQTAARAEPRAPADPAR
jgi:methionine sulfoxide reductase heme-binding subunit